MAGNNINMMLNLSPGTPVTGQWCDECQLPSGVDVPLNVLFDSGVQPVGNARICTNHDNFTEGAADDPDDEDQ